MAAARCDRDGVSGNRTEVLYVRTSDRPDRFEAYLPSLRTWASDSDRIYQTSAAKTGGLRNIRFVHDGGCTVTVGNVVVPPDADDDLDRTIVALARLGFNRPDRKYLLFVDANVYCGIGDMTADDRPGQENTNNHGPSYGRVDAGCWNGRTLAHEHMHTLGAVQPSAPHASGGHHCVDENDVMCYSDRPDHPTVTVVCPGVSAENLLDCNDDDYFHTNPAPGSYLAARWNTANSRFLSGSAQGTGTVVHDGTRGRPPVTTRTPEPQKTPCRTVRLVRCDREVADEREGARWISRRPVGGADVGWRWSSVAAAWCSPSHRPSPPAATRRGCGCSSQAGWCSRRSSL